MRADCDRDRHEIPLLDGLLKKLRGKPRREAPNKARGVSCERGVVVRIIAPFHRITCYEPGGTGRPLRCSFFCINGSHLNGFVIRDRGTVRDLQP